MKKTYRITFLPPLDLQVSYFKQITEGFLSKKLSHVGKQHRISDLQCYSIENQQDSLLGAKCRYFERKIQSWPFTYFRPQNFLLNHSRGHSIRGSRGCKCTVDLLEIAPFQVKMLGKLRHFAPSILIPCGAPALKFIKYIPVRHQKWSLEQYSRSIQRESPEKPHLNILTLLHRFKRFVIFFRIYLQQCARSKQWKLLRDMYENSDGSKI